MNHSLRWLQDVLHQANSRHRVPIGRVIQSLRQHQTTPATDQDFPPPIGFHLHPAHLRFSAMHHPMRLDQAHILLVPLLLPGTTMNLGPISPLLLPYTSRLKGRGVYLQPGVGTPFSLVYTPGCNE